MVAVRFDLSDEGWAALALAAREAEDGASHPSTSSPLIARVSGSAVPKEASLYPPRRSMARRPSGPRL